VSRKRPALTSAARETFQSGQIGVRIVVLDQFAQFGLRLPPYRNDGIEQRIALRREVADAAVAARGPLLAHQSFADQKVEIARQRRAVHRDPLSYRRHRFTGALAHGAEDGELRNGDAERTQTLVVAPGHRPG